MLSRVTKYQTDRWVECTNDSQFNALFIIYQINWNLRKSQVDRRECTLHYKFTIALIENFSHSFYLYLRQFFPNALSAQIQSAFMNANVRIRGSELDLWFPLADIISRIFEARQCRRLVWRDNNARLDKYVKVGKNAHAIFVALRNATCYSIRK